MNILLLGKNGQVGWELQRSLAPLGTLQALDRHDADLGHPAALAEMIRSRQPDVIVNAAAHTAVDRAESEAALAQAINTDAPALLAQEARALGALLVHYSTDYVFDGSGERPWQEDDVTAPLSVYGRTKRDGELAIRASGCRHLIFRTSWVYGARGNNFARTMLRLAKEREHLTVISDQTGAPTGADLIADISAHAIRAVFTDAAREGTYHLAAGGATSWHGYASFVIDAARRAGVALTVEPAAIAAVPTSTFPTAAQRPLNSRLDTRKLQTAFALTLPPWQTGVNRLLTEILET